MSENTAKMLSIDLKEIEIAGEPIQTVNLRELHAFLENKAQFSNWAKERIEQYGFVENQDYTIILGTGKIIGRGRPSIEYFGTIDMAKELSMVERNEQGREARKYFIECERKLRGSSRQPAPIEDLSQIDAARRLAASSNALVKALEDKEEAEKAAKEAQRRINESVLFQRSAISNRGAGCIALTDIKAKYAPWLSVTRIEQWLNYIGHPRGSHRREESGPAVISIPFVAAGLKAAFDRLIREVEKGFNHERTRATLRHDCFLTARVRVSRENAIRYLKYDRGAFKSE